MWLRVSGEDVAADVLDLIAAITDRAVLRPADIVHDKSEESVRIPLRRLPLVRTRRVLPNVHARDRRIETVVTVRHVSACQVNCDMENDSEDVQLLFGLQLQRRSLTACSAEELHGQPFLAVEIDMTSLDVELADVPGDRS